MSRTQLSFKQRICYLIYRLIAQHLPQGLGIIGNFSGFLRKKTSGPLFKSVGEHFSVGAGASFGDGSCLELGEYSNLGQGFCFTGNGRLVFGEHIMMGYDCMFITSNHKALPGVGYSGYENKDIIVGSHVWFGHRVIVLPGVSIGDHSILAAGTVVSKDVPEFAIVAGNPASIVKLRKR